MTSAATHRFLADEAMRQGARGFLIKTTDADTLVASIRSAHAGEPVIDAAMTGKLIAQFRQQSAPPAPRHDGDAMRNQFTTRERQVAQLLARGASNKVIARELDVTESTVKIHVQNVLKKLNLTSRVQIAVYMVEHGLTLDEVPARPGS